MTKRIIIVCTIMAAVIIMGGLMDAAVFFGAMFTIVGICYALMRKWEAERDRLNYERMRNELHRKMLHAA